jgi:hypothetical protein
MMAATRSEWSRRDFTGAAALLALALGIPAAAVKLSELDDGDAPSQRQQQLMNRVVDIVIPRTGTAGAADVGVGDFVILALAHGLSATRDPMASGAVTAALKPFRRRDGSLRHLAWLEQVLNRAAGGDFLRQPRERATALLADLDAQAFVRDAAYSPWVAIKGLILTGYYTSEAGGSQELRYELVPGRWDANIPLTPGMRAFSSDWTAVDFG